MQDLETVLRRALETLAFQAPDMGECVVHDQVRSHLRHHPDPIMVWEIYRAAYDAVYDLENNRVDPYKYCDLAPNSCTFETAREMAVLRWQGFREEALTDIIFYEKKAA